jgi:hypothetical protein
MKTLFELLTESARERADGHFAVMRFTGNWRVGFGTPSDRFDIDAMHVGSTFEQAAKAALNESADAYRRRMYRALQARIASYP